MLIQFYQRTDKKIRARIWIKNGMGMVLKCLLYLSFFNLFKLDKSRGQVKDISDWFRESLLVMAI